MDSIPNLEKLLSIELFAYLWISELLWSRRWGIRLALSSNKLGLVLWMKFIRFKLRIKLTTWSLPVHLIETRPITKITKILKPTKFWSLFSFQLWRHDDLLPWFGFAHRFGDCRRFRKPLSGWTGAPARWVEGGACQNGGRDSHAQTGSAIFTLILKAAFTLQWFCCD